MKTILLVEDNDNNLYLISFILKNRGYEVIEARTGAIGLELARSEDPDLILMDLQLPDLHGLDVTRRLRRGGLGPGTPILALTSFAMPGDREKALSAGCTGYIEKPIDPLGFLDEIERQLSRGAVLRARGREERGGG